MNEGRFTIVGLDLATVTGLAFWSTGMERPRSLRLQMPSGEEWNGRAFRKLYESLWSVHQIVGEDYPIHKIYFEQPINTHMVKNTGAQAIRRAVGWATVCEMFADVIGVPCLEVPISSWRQNFFKAGRGIPRAEAKRAAMARCRELGWYPEDDNCADALGILNYALTVCEGVTVPWAEQLKPRATAGGVE